MWIYILSTIKQKIPSIVDYLGQGEIKSTSCGIVIANGYKHFILYDKNNSYKSLKYRSKNDGFKDDDIFRLTYDFINGKIIIYHNDICADKISFGEYNYKSIIPAFSLYTQSTQIEIIKWNFS